MAFSSIWIALRWCPSFHSNLAFSIVADPSPSCDACRTALKDCWSEFDFRARRALDSHRDDMSPSENLGLRGGLLVEASHCVRGWTQYEPHQFHRRTTYAEHILLVVDVGPHNF